MIHILKILFTPFLWVPMTGWCVAHRPRKNGNVSDVAYHKIYRKGKHLRIIEIREIIEE